MRPLAASSLLIILIAACAGQPGGSDSQNVGLISPLQNGGFESGLTGWTSTGTTSTSTVAHSGAASGQAGSTTAGVLSTLAQTFTDSGGGTLSFWYQGFCNDTVTYAWATASLEDNTSGTTTTLLAKTCSKSGTWKQVTSGALTSGHSYTLTLSNQSEVYKTDYNYTLFDDVGVSGGTAGNDFSIALAPASASVAAGNSTAFTVSTAVTSGSAESVSLVVSGLPAGVTGSFSAGSVTSGGSATLTLTAASSAAASSATFTVTGTATSGSHATAASLSVTTSAPGNDFSLSLTPTSATAAPGGTATYTVNTGIASGSAETVSLSVSGLPTGVSGSFAATSLSSGQSTTMILTASASSGGATGTFVVTGSASSGSHAATASITVAAANDFSISLSPASQSIAQGSSAAYTVSTATVSGTAQSVSLSAAGLPAGVTGAFSPASVTSGGSSTLTLTASASATAGSATFTATGSAASGAHSASAGVTVTASASGGVGINGGSVDHLYFAVIGDTRPSTIDNVNGYPTAIIDKIYQDIQAMNPRPQFIVSTGDYMYANTNTNTAQTQATLYETARKTYTGTEFPAMGNHECDGYTADNCTSLTQTDNIKAFMSTFIAPLGRTEPYYSVPITALDGSWTAKLVVVACNYWNTTQQTWLTLQLAGATTYTILARHEPASANTGPCVSNVQSLMGKNPYDLSLVGHTHTFSVSSKEVVIGNGGAPLASSANGIFGYGTVEKVAAGWQIKEYDYSTGLAVDTFTVP